MRGSLANLLLVGNLTSFAAVVGAVYLLAHGNTHGWGWLLIVALLCHVGPRSQQS